MRKGFTLIEVMLAGAILAIGCLGVLSMLLTVVDHNDVSQHRTDATYLAEMLLDQLEVQVCGGGGVIPTKPAEGKWTSGDDSRFYTKTGFLIGNTSNAAATDGWVYRVDYYRLPRDASYTKPDDVYRGALRVSWHKSERLGTCEPDTLDTRTAKRDTECDAITLPFAFVKNDFVTN